MDHPIPNSKRADEPVKTEPVAKPASPERRRFDLTLQQTVLSIQARRWRLLRRLPRSTLGGHPPELVTTLPHPKAENELMTSSRLTRRPKSLNRTTHQAEPARSVEAPQAGDGQTQARSFAVIERSNMLLAEITAALERCHARSGY
jgi:hypothetical protein